MHEHANLNVKPWHAVAVEPIPELLFHDCLNEYCVSYTGTLSYCSIVFAPADATGTPKVLRTAVFPDCGHATDFGVGGTMPGDGEIFRTPDDVMWLAEPRSGVTGLQLALG